MKQIGMVMMSFIIIIKLFGELHVVDVGWCLPEGTCESSLALTLCKTLPKRAALSFSVSQLT